MATLQTRVGAWVHACFGPVIAGDRVERNHRFLEEAIELFQACDGTASEAYQLVDYTFARPVGAASQEVGGVVLTLAALCLARDLDMDEAGEAELARVWGKVEQIRAKQAAKPKHSPLPAAPQLSAGAPSEQAKLALRDWRDTLLALHTYMTTVLGKPAPPELFARVSAAHESMGFAIDRPAVPIGYVIEHADGGSWRTLDSTGMPEWTTDRSEALCLSLRKHADAFACDDPEDVRIRPVYAGVQA